MGQATANMLERFGPAPGVVGKAATSQDHALPDGDGFLALLGMHDRSHDAASFVLLERGELVLGQKRDLQVECCLGQTACEGCTETESRVAAMGGAVLDIAQHLFDGMHERGPLTRHAHEMEKVY